MTLYAPLDVHFDEHPKHVELELEHFGLMACGITHCNRLRTDGFVSDKAVRGFGASGKGPKAAAQLVEAGRWTRVNGGYQIVGYLDHNPSRVQIEARQAANRERKKKYETKREGNAAPSCPPDAQGTSSATRSGHVPERVPNALPDALRTGLSPSPSPSPSPTDPPKPPEGPGVGQQTPEPIRGPLKDPELLTAFRSVLAANGLGHKHVPNAKWQELSERFGSWTPGMAEQDRHELLRRSVARWCQQPEAQEARYPVSLFLTWAADQEGIGRKAQRLAERQEAAPSYQITPADEAAAAAGSDELLKLLEAS